MYISEVEHQNHRLQRQLDHAVEALKNIHGWDLPLTAVPINPHSIAAKALADLFEPRIWG